MDKWSARSLNSNGISQIIARTFAIRDVSIFFFVLFLNNHFRLGDCLKSELELLECMAWIFGLVTFTGLNLTVASRAIH